MGIKTTKQFSGKTETILNGVRNSASEYYQTNVPSLSANSTLSDLNRIGSILIADTKLQNEFIRSLMNRIGLVIIRSKMFKNPWNMFKYGELELGEVVEEIFVDLAKPYSYDPERAEKEIFKREIPNVKTAFHRVDYCKYYKITIQNESLKKAFITWNGVEELISRITESLYNAMNYDEFLAMKYLIGQKILNGEVKVIEIPEPVDIDSANAVVSKIRGVSNAFRFMGNSYNNAGVQTFSDIDDQYLISSSNFDAVTSVDVLAKAFNMDSAKFLGHQILVDDFGNLDIERLNFLLKDYDDYIEPSQEELEQLSNISAILADKSFFLIVDSLLKFTENYNGEGLYWNYWLHVWKCLSTSSFANVVAFVSGKPVVTGISVTPTEITLPIGGKTTIIPNVSTEFFAPTSVTFISDNENVSVDSSGNVEVLATATTQETATITVTSTFDTTKTATCTVTVS